MTNPFITNINLEQAVNDAKIDQEQKNTLIAQLPHLDESSRIKLLELLKEIIFLNLEEVDATKKIKENWQ